MKNFIFRGTKYAYHKLMGIPVGQEKKANEGSSSDVAASGYLKLLPNEILKMILLKLSIKDRLNFSATSHFNYIINSDVPYVTKEMKHLKFDDACKEIKNQMDIVSTLEKIRQQTKASKERLEKLDIFRDSCDFATIIRLTICFGTPVTLLILSTIYAVNSYQAQHPDDKETPALIGVGMGLPGSLLIGACLGIFSGCTTVRRHALAQQETNLEANLVVKKNNIEKLLR